MSPPTAADPGVTDAVTFEVIRNKLGAIAEEQAITLKSVSGSPVVTDATDFNNGLYLTDGSIVTMGPQVLVHSGSMSTVIRSILAEFGEGTIHEGDMFILNDPYRGAVHQPDVSIVAPVFHAGRQIAWTGICAHELDVGGMSFGSWAYEATEVQQEAMLLPGVKLVERGELREDLWRMILGMSRLPTLLGLDLKAMIAANNVAIRRLGEVIDRYGADVVVGVMETEIENSERQFRAKLRELPDGVFSARDFIEHDGHEDVLYDIAVTVTKVGDSLTVDMTGSSPQAPGFINCTMAGLRGSVFASVLPILAPDIRWNDGILRPIEIKAPEGVICNATWPAPVSMATVATMWIVQNVSVLAFSRLAAAGWATAKEAMGVTKGSMLVLTLTGRGRDGEPYGNFLLDSTAGGGGAYVDHDGLDGSGDFNVPRPSVTNVEANEANGPLLYLYRSYLPDSAGPGRQRGGSTVGIAITPHDTDELGAMMVGHGMRVPNSSGLFGGSPGSCNYAGTVAAVDSDDLLRATGPEKLRELGEYRALGPKPGRFVLARGEAFAYSFQGGGGFGDPLLRDPTAVLADVERSLVGVASAADHYGVVIVDGAVDTDATERERERLSVRRLEGAAEPDTSAAIAGGDDWREMGGTFRLHTDGSVGCLCGHPLAPPGGNWKRAARTRVVSPDELGVHVRLREELELRQHFCPDCGALLETETARRGAESSHSFEFFAREKGER
jgi:N-methylhydantoinase B